MPTPAANPKSNWLTTLGRRLQLDRPLFYALLAKCWQAVTGPITLMLVITAMTVPEQGVYYGLVGIVGIQGIFELGLLNVLISHAGNQSALLKQLAAEGKQTRQSLAAERMGVLIRSSQRWFFVASLLFILLGYAVGWYTFSSLSTELNWQFPLLCVLPIAAISIALAPALAILEGAGYREPVYRFRFFQMATGSVIVWIALFSGLKLWTIVAAAFIQSFWAGYITLRYHSEFFAHYRNAAPPADGFSWWRDIVPMQWRAAAISAAHYAASQMFVLIVLGRVAADSAIDAGRLGPTLTITAAIQTLALVWVQTKYSVISEHHGAGEREQAGTMWRRTTLLSTGLLVLALSTLILLIASLKFFETGYENNFLLPWQLVILSIGYVANHLLAVQSFYVMARRDNPFWVPLVIGLSLTALCVWYFGRTYSTTGLVIAYAATTSLITLPLHTWAYLKYRVK